MAGESEVKGGRRLPVLQAVIVFAVAALVAGLAIPALAAQAKSSVLKQNQAALALQVKAEMVLLPDTGLPLDASRFGDDEASAPAALAADLRRGAAGSFVNPYGGSAAIVCSDAPPASDAASSPAVWITDDPHYSSATFRPSQLSRSRLAGCLVVAFSWESGATRVDVYYVDADGQQSHGVEHLTGSSSQVTDK
jgi:hypothetical protein